MRISKTPLLKNIVLSEFQVALRASERVQEEAHRETKFFACICGECGSCSCRSPFMCARAGAFTDIVIYCEKWVRQHGCSQGKDSNNSYKRAWEATMELGEVITDDTQSSYYCSRAHRMRSS
ncbi:unnamed protein product [Sphagnum balticum]